ncbi:hypothetical protein KRR38_01410 [Novosphingobium sp. G106]|uniref:hypothetical protein n=1 Tax=Novosphingobium sp. G106 TaxID=2849500 RepID=UPI001C2CDB93|nr:hypothetical protein [Novosphingobium sp. G106]MBV1686362.1 hypothetical protein [Novosphingobium sp. G106]
MPPIARHTKSKIRYHSRDGVVEIVLPAEEVVTSRFKKISTVRLTPALISKLKAACADHLVYLQGQLAVMKEDTEDEVKARRPLASKVKSLEDQLGGSETWLGLFGDRALPAVGKCDKMRGCIYVAQGPGWTHPAHPAVVLIVGEEESEPKGDNPVADDGEVAAGQARSQQVDLELVADVGGKAAVEPVLIRKDQGRERRAKPLREKPESRRD